MNLDNVIFVWGENVNPAPPAPPPTVSVSAWPFLFGKTWLKWDTLADAPPASYTAEVAFVNLFHTSDSTHIEQIKRLNPHCTVVAMPDPCLDLVLSHPDWGPMWEQMALADLIGGRTHADCAVYGTLLGKGTVYLPSPIGPDEFFIPYRNLPRDDYLLTLDHPMQPGMVAQNVAALAAIQRQTGIRVLYAAARDHTRHLARLASLTATFMGNVGWLDFVDLTARARLCVDVYARHSYGRQAVLSAMVGTPFVGSDYCKDAPGEMANPFDPLAIASEACSYLSLGPSRVETQYNYAHVAREFSFTASRARLLQILDRIEKVDAH
jgi:hypothetical protein